MPAKVTINGECDPRFSRVRDTFIQNFEQRGEVGAATSIVVDGRCVVDLWAGHADQAKTRPWNRDTIVNVWSTTKGLCAMCAHRLADQGKLDFDAPVAKYWPEFAQGGKGSIPVSALLNHQAGLAAIRTPLAPDDIFSWEKVTGELARQEPWWNPGTKHGYHAITFGWLVGEVVRRISGKSLGTYFRDEIAKPLGAEAYIGIGPEFDARVAEIIYAPAPKPGEPNLFADIMKDPASVGAMALFNPPTTFQQATTNSRAWRAPKSPVPTAPRTPVRSRVSMARWPVAARLTACVFSVRAKSSVATPSNRGDRTRYCRSPPVSAWALCSRSPVRRWVLTLTLSAIREPAVRSASPIPTPRSASAT